MNKAYETVIGLEVHVELSTASKIFCGCSTAFGAKPNEHTCPVCLGMPGTLPVLNRRVLKYAVAVGLALNCHISRQSRFDRKNYFYPDNPQNYQISQLYSPICTDGYVELDGEQGGKRVRIHELHMEEDAGKLIHDEQDNITLVDYNRAGVPLLEIVTEPDMRSSEEVLAFLDKLRMFIRYLGVSDCKMQEGSMRVDVNLSVRPLGSETLGTRTEMKNLGSFRAISHAIASEKERQIALLEQSIPVTRETRRWDEDRNESFSMRSKEDIGDYRYFPEPDLPPVIVTEKFIETIAAGLPEFREEKRARYRAEYDIPEYDIGILTESKKLADIFEACVKQGAAPKTVSNWLMGETLRLLKTYELEPEEITFSPSNLTALIAMVGAKQINQATAKEIFEVIFREDAEPVSYARSNGLLIQQDETALRSAVETVIAENTKSVGDYLSGKEKALGFLVGQTMRALKGKGDPGTVTALLKECLAKEAAPLRESSAKEAAPLRESSAKEAAPLRESPAKEAARTDSAAAEAGDADK